MKAVCLITNSHAHSDLDSEHGLSFYIETPEFKLLFDTGKSGLFIENSKKIGIDLSEIDFAVISHGHYDHAGGLIDFLAINKTAKVFIKKEALAEKYKITPGGLKDVGLLNIDILHKYDDRIIFSEQRVRISEDIWILSNLENPNTNHNFFVKDFQGKIVKDPFIDEQFIVIRNGRWYNIFTGCSHNGILHIIDFVNKIFKPEKINVIAGGFHLNDKRTGEVKVIARKIKAYNINRIYTGHCSSDFADNKIVKAELFGSGTEIEF